MVEFLLNNKADVDSKGFKNHTPLFSAAGFGNS